MIELPVAESEQVKPNWLGQGDSVWILDIRACLAAFLQFSDDNIIHIIVLTIMSYSAIMSL